jgi:hypothetical protein
MHVAAELYRDYARLFEEPLFAEGNVNNRLRAPFWDL